MIVIKQRGEQIIIEEDSILYIVADGSYSKLVMEDKRKILISKPLSQIEKILDFNFLLRINRSTIINIKFVSKAIFNRKKIVFLNGNKEFVMSIDKAELLNCFIKI